MKPTANPPRTLSELNRLITLAGRMLYRNGPSALFSRLVHRHRYKVAQRATDARYGTDTLAMRNIDDFSAAGPNLSHAYEYHPTPAHQFNEILKQLPITCSDYVFLDLGCGKGLALLLAAPFGFRRIIGVEFEQTLYTTALSNVEKFRQHNASAPRITVLLEDAAEFPFPTEPLLIYLYNPFGPEVVRKVLANLQTSLLDQPRACWIVYVNPLHHALFAEREFLAVHTANTSDKSEDTYAVYTSRDRGSK